MFCPDPRGTVPSGRPSSEPGGPTLLQSLVSNQVYPGVTWLGVPMACPGRLLPPTTESLYVPNLPYQLPSPGLPSCPQTGGAGLPPGALTRHPCQELHPWVGLGGLSLRIPASRSPLWPSPLSAVTPALVCHLAHWFVLSLLSALRDPWITASGAGPRPRHSLQIPRAQPRTPSPSRPPPCGVRGNE